MIPHLRPVNARPLVVDTRLHAIIAKRGPLTADERAYLEQREREAA